MRATTTTTTSTTRNLCLLSMLLIFLPYLANGGDPMTGMVPTTSMGNWSPFCHRFRVHVIDGVSSNAQPLLLHCWSRDNDLGNHTLYIGGDFNFHFWVRVVPPFTRFTCDMRWAQKHQTVTVFNRAHVEDWCCLSGQCYWRAQDDGIYFSNNNSSYTKIYTWS
ncbi:hypothetical protein Tsubulata_024503 [Turnera subulata]|uniref:S-protein homolog n=1 Tax=Turnera subulata TaxID=218843 RepID=A0A9Q0J3R6_9ROSI|nr:hypothetical protein Tsubulata_024503 [Turnera subulata]